MAEPTFRLPVAGFEQIARILKAYVGASKGIPFTPVKLDDVAKRAAISKPAVSGNNAFLASLNLIEGGNNKQLTHRGLRAALTLDHPGTPEAFEAWTDVIEASPDLERVLDAVRIRRGMDEDALLSHIVLTAGVPKTARSLTGAHTIVEVLEFAGVLRESEGTFRVETPAEASDRSTTPEVEAVPSLSIQPSRSTAASRVALNVHIWVSAKDVDFDELADELKQLLSRLSET